MNKPIYRWLERYSKSISSVKCPEYYRPNMQVDQLGCKAEMIAQYFFWSHKAKYKATQIFRS